MFQYSNFWNTSKMHKQYHELFLSFALCRADPEGIQPVAIDLVTGCPVFTMRIECEGEHVRQAMW